MRVPAAVLVSALLIAPAAALAGPGIPPAELPPSAGESSTPLLPPVDGTLLVRYAAPGTDWGPGHRGVDFAAAPGTPVRAAADGEVTFAGPVGNLRAVTLVHGTNLETTYSSLDEIHVRPGDRVTAGGWLGTTAAAHPGGDGGLHFGVKHLGRYVDPETYLGPLDLEDAIYLVPDHHVHTGELDRRFNAHPLDDGSGDCTPLRAVPQGAPPPSDNVVVVVGGYNSVPSSPAFSIPERLGYAPGDVYRFSYKGLDAPGLFEPYEKKDTHDDLTRHAFRFRRLLIEIARRHPGRGVDVLAHSQGGLVVRDALSLLIDDWDPELPFVENVVTYATPHRGTRLADAPDVLDDGSVTLFLLEGVRVSSGVDPWGESVGQVRPGSRYLAEVTASDVTLGTRALALSIPNDFVVPAHRATWPGEASRTIPPVGLSGHEAILGSPDADAMAYAYLRGAPVTCDVADGLGRDLGRMLSAGHLAAPWLLRWAEETGKSLASRSPIGGAIVTIIENLAGWRRAASERDR